MAILIVPLSIFVIYLGVKLLRAGWLILNISDEEMEILVEALRKEEK